MAQPQTCRHPFLAKMTGPCAAGLARPDACAKYGRMAQQLDYHAMHAIFTRFRNSDPEPKGELNHINAYTLLVAVALSAQATDVGVNKATEKLFKIADTPQKMLDLGLEGLTEHIKTIGLFAALQSLPGVGRKTANVVLNSWFHYPAQPVDTHIFRFGNRTGVAVGKDVSQVERAIEDHVPVEFQQHAHHWMILHGRYICKARKPVCANCIIEDLCPFEEKTL
jgi:endonuclease-3